MLRNITIAGLILPLTIDTFVLGTALGAAGIAVVAAALLIAEHIAGI